MLRWIKRRYAFTVQARDIDGNLSPVSDPVFVTTDPADPNDHTPPTQPTNITANNDGAFINLRWDPSTDDVAPQSFIRYDVPSTVSCALLWSADTRRKLKRYGVTNNISIIAVDTADNESVPGTITVIH